MAARVIVEIEDVGGKFARLYQTATKAARRNLGLAVATTTTQIGNRMRNGAPVGPDWPHIRDTVTEKTRGMRGEVGYRKEDFGGDEAGGSPGTTIAEVALFNEYAPNSQPYIRPAAESEAKAFETRARAALKALETL